ncbi:BC_2427 family protein [Sporosarcina contaminans]|uniref:BC_2427 family protein n=1 Tax=Sporosarcina contaminans TaxID=633403 RepID=UPI0036D431DA
MNSEEIKQRAFIRQIVVHTIGVEDETDDETDNPMHDALEDQSEENHAPVNDENTEEVEATSVCHIEKKCKGIQDESQDFPEEFLSDLEAVNEFAEMRQNDFPVEMNHSVIAELTNHPSSISESINETTSNITDLTLISTGDFSNREDKSIGFGISQLIHALKLIETIRTDYSTTTDASHHSIHDLNRKHEVNEKNSTNKQLEVERLLRLLKQVEVLKKATSEKVEHVIYSQTENESIHSSTLKNSTARNELTDSNMLREDFGINGVIERHEENIESKQMIMEQLINVLKKVQLTKNEQPIDDATLLQAEMASIDSSSSNTPANNVEAHESFNTAVESECDGNQSNPKQIAVERLITLVKTIANNKEKLPTQKDERLEDNADEMIEPSAQMALSNTIHCKTINIPFSTMIEMNDFLHAPLFGEVSQHTFDFLDPDNTKSIQMDTKFVSTTTHYPEQIICHLISSSIHEVITVSNVSQKDRRKHKNKQLKSNVIPLHTNQKAGESKRTEVEGNCKKIKVPVVIGEYSIETSVEEEILFEEQVISIKENSKNIIIENSHFTPTRLSKPIQNGACAALGGMLSLEGVIVQNIRYSELPNQDQEAKEKTEPIYLNEKILLELKIQLLQDQEMHIKEKCNEIR